MCSPAGCFYFMFTCFHFPARSILTVIQAEILIPNQNEFEQRLQ